MKLWVLSSVCSVLLYKIVRSCLLCVVCYYMKLQVHAFYMWYVTVRNCQAMPSVYGSLSATRLKESSDYILNVIVLYK